jgi:hypothetical protein
LNLQNNYDIMKSIVLKNLENANWMKE